MEVTVLATSSPFGPTIVDTVAAELALLKAVGANDRLRFRPSALGQCAIGPLPVGVKLQEAGSPAVRRDPQESLNWRDLPLVRRPGPSMSDDRDRKFVSRDRILDTAYELCLPALASGPRSIRSVAAAVARVAERRAAGLAADWAPPAGRLLALVGVGAVAGGAAAGEADAPLTEQEHAWLQALKEYAETRPALPDASAPLTRADRAVWAALSVLFAVPDAETRAVAARYGGLVNFCERVHHACPASWACDATFLAGAREPPPVHVPTWQVLAWVAAAAGSVLVYNADYVRRALVASLAAVAANAIDDDDDDDDDEDDDDGEDE